MTTKNDNYRNALPRIRELTRGSGCYYPEIRLLVHPFSTRATYLLAQLGISPNTTTYIGTIFSTACLWFFFDDQYLAAFVSYVVRLVLDYADGSLARFTQTFSAFGAKLDLFCDYFFYIPFWVLVWIKLDDLTQSVFLLSAALGYILVVDCYVEPRLKTLNRRAALKNFFMTRGFIVGFAPFGILELWSIVFFMAAIPQEYYSLLPALVMIDLIYRVYEIVRFGE